MLSRAKANGNVANGKVAMTATEVGGQGRAVTVDGTLRSDGWFTVNITRSDVDLTSPRQVQAAVANLHGSSGSQPGC